MFTRVSFSDRLNKIFQERGINQTEAARKIGVSRQAIARWLKGTAEPERDKVIALAEFLELSPAYLMFGNAVSSDSLQIDDDMVRLLRVAKQWIFANCANAKLNKLHIINAFDDSMKPTIGKGDLIIVDTSKTMIVGDGIYAIQAGDDTFIKRVQRQVDGSVLLLSDNPHYQPYKVPPEDRETMKIVGKCIINCKAEEL